MPDALKVREMFGRVARRYDFANLLISGGFSKLWTRRLAKDAVAFLRSATGSGQPRGTALTNAADLATGSGDVAFALAARLACLARRANRPAGTYQITGLDFCEPMLEVARRRAASISNSHPVPRFALGDCLALPLADNSQAVVTIAYGVRNLQDRRRGLCEIFRVLKPGGAAFILEFSQPYRWFRPLYFLYLRTFLPVLAAIATGDKSAYKYLGDSISTFPDRDAFAGELRNVGFSKVTATPLTLGIVALHRAVKPELTNAQ